MDEFIPDGYEVPESPSNYMKLKDGENTFRAMSSAIMGYVYWNTDNKPVRNKIGWVDMPEDIKVNKDGSYSIKHFWAFIIYNYSTKQVQVFELTQKTIQTAVKALVKNTKWGNPKGYDISITREGKDLDTVYTVMPNPHSEMPIEATDQFLKKNINLEALFEGKDPFNTL